MRHNFSGQNLQGKSFRGQDLVNADFRQADIRGTDFRNTDLTGANFSQAQAGIQNVHKLGLFWLGFVLAIVAGAATRFSAGIAVGSPQPLILAIFIVFVFVIGKQGFTTSIVTMITSIATGLILLGMLVGLFQLAGHKLLGLDLILVMSLAWKLAGSLFWALTATCSSVLAYLSLNWLTRDRKWRMVASIAYLAIYLFAWSFVFIFFQSHQNKFPGNQFPGFVVMADQISNWSTSGFPIVLAISTLITLLARYIGCQINLQNKSYRFELLSTVAISLPSIWGTRFQGANLTEANFSRSTLDFTDLRFAKLVRTNLLNARYLHQARLDGTIIESHQIQRLVTSLWGVNQDYRNCLPQGLYLREANLEGANLTGADLRECDLRGVNLTGACIENWNLDHTTKLEGVVCNYAYRDMAKTQRIPASGQLQSGDFEKLFQQIHNMIDLIFHNGFHLEAFLQTWQQFQLEYADQSPTIRSIENKGDGVFVLKIEVDPAADRVQLHQDLIQAYEQKIQQFTAQYQAKIAHRDGQLVAYHDQFQSIFDRLMPSQDNRSSTHLAVLKFGSGNVQSGFSVTLQIGIAGQAALVECKGALEGNPELLFAYKQWRSLYRQSIRENIRLEIPQIQTTNIGLCELFQDCTEAATVLKTKLNDWLDTPAFRPLAVKLREILHPSQAIQAVLQTDDAQLRQIPFHLWNFFDSYLKAEIAVSNEAYEKCSSPTDHNTSVRILCILGNSNGIDVNRDYEFLQTLPNSEVHLLVEPARKQLNDELWQQSWDILFFAGHSYSSSKDNKGFLQINQTEHLTIPELKYALRKAITAGLHLAIFNSCDGLGLATNIADLHIPQTIVMREPIPDRVAQEFLQNFLSSLSQGTPFYQSLRAARERLQGIENEFPCASWLPILCQNLAEGSFQWPSS
jgi:uncharacterized protein YjbI with pentapeptide repeats